MEVVTSESEWPTRSIIVLRGILFSAKMLIVVCLNICGDICLGIGFLSLSFALWRDLLRIELWIGLPVFVTNIRSLLYQFLSVNSLKRLSSIIWSRISTSLSVRCVVLKLANVLVPSSSGMYRLNVVWISSVFVSLWYLSSVRPANSPTRHPFRIMNSHAKAYLRVMSFR